MIRADVHKPFFRKFLFVFLGCVLMAGWFLYDGLIGYPHQLVIAEAYEALPEEGRLEAWREMAAEKGWPRMTPAKFAKDLKHDITGQFVWATISMAFGIPALAMFWSGRGTWVEGDESVIRNSRGAEVPIEAITKIDKRKWDAKGIAKIHFEVDGKTNKFVMDDFKYDRKPMGEIMRFAEAGLSADQVDGDMLEREKDAIAEKEAAENAAAEAELAEKMGEQFEEDKAATETP